MKKMTLDKTWERCLAMWEWIASEIKNGTTDPPGTLKGEWLKDHRYKNAPKYD